LKAHSTENYFSRFLDPTNRAPWNTLRPRRGEGEEHFIAKARKFYELDIVDLTDGAVYEIAVSEKEESLHRKKSHYPREFLFLIIKKRRHGGI
jgi:hypothetical protein